MRTVQSDRQFGVEEDPTVERAQSVRELQLPNHLPKGLTGRHEPTVRDLELRLPRFEKDFLAPHRTDEKSVLARARGHMFPD